jgi:hypothetical protein
MDWDENKIIAYMPMNELTIVVTRTSRKYYRAENSNIQYTGFV